MWPAIIAGGAALAGGILGNKQRSGEASKNRRFQERMRNTQWQAAVQDMEKAGLNPALAYSQGPNASPGGSMAQQMDVATPAISSAMQAKRMQADLRNLNTTNSLISKQIEKTGAETEAARINADTARARLLAYGVERTPTGSLKMKMEGGAFPLMTEEILANIRNVQQRTAREGATTRAMMPLAELADKIGIALPILGLASQFNPAGLLRSAGSIFKGKKLPFRRR